MTAGRKTKARAKARPSQAPPPAPRAEPAPPAAGVKRGGLSRNDKLAIESRAGKETAESIASKLRRAPAQVQAYLDEIGAADVKLKVGQNLSMELEDRPEWAEFRAQYDAAELKFIKYRYVQLMNQFGRDDVLPTEEMQIFSLIHMEAMANQAMRERKTLITRQKAVQDRLEEAYEDMKPLDPRSGEGREQQREIQGLEGDFAQVSEALKAVNARHSSHLMQQNNLLGSLKATRDQRVKVIEGSKASFLGFLKALTQEDFRREKGHEMEMMRVAMEKERRRISRDTEYVDGTVDKPLLTPESVMEEGEDE